MLRALFRTFLVAAFLLAQTAGIAHQAWHDAGASAAHASTDGGESKAPAKNPLCDFHVAFAGVLGAIQGVHTTAVAIASPQSVFVAAEIPAARFSSLAPQSRAPPAVL